LDLADIVLPKAKLLKSAVFSKSIKPRSRRLALVAFEKTIFTFGATL
jgi:hypothetical protein